MRLRSRQYGKHGTLAIQNPGRSLMPEGDSLVRLAHRLRPVVHEQVLVCSDFRTPKLATADLAGWQVEIGRASCRERVKVVGVDRAGKKKGDKREWVHM